ncbi:N-acetylmuramoyl-L-alanine amidase [Desulfotomaculum arcticum]|uniref:N-acetylmuramoyl-L-alanine amidase n=1 Tax=Desulfotruncus arcticus DSM 17038 TaxID=1121424 RepID=A0A1I2YB63_9FIRM|nr:cell wall hydrolase [Desulfotruncus arcticus]SFH22862.1 N-acetylmuramoyl-L-alanine amidase [Desulfotomaculum arcticum] [Desulfotruncus arcticus DSM 17038]
MFKTWIRVLVLAAVIMAAFIFVVNADASTLHQVKPGDTLWRISNVNGVPVNTLQTVNGMAGGNIIYSGQKLLIPDTYRVRAGDSLWKISRNYGGIPIQAIKLANGLNSDYLYVGQILYIPAPVLVPASEFTPKEMDLFARMIYAESKGEPYKGQVGVGAVILNRVKDSRFPNTIADVLYQPWAFSPVYDGSFYNTPNDTARQAAQDAVSGYDPTYGALYFWNPSLVGAYNWVWTREITTQIGNHIFAR